MTNSYLYFDVALQFCQLGVFLVKTGHLVQKQRRARGFGLSQCAQQLQLGFVGWNGHQGGQVNVEQIVGRIIAGQRFQQAALFADRQRENKIQKVDQRLGVAGRHFQHPLGFPVDQPFGVIEVIEVAVGIGRIAELAQDEAFGLLLVRRLVQ